MTITLGHAEAVGLCAVDRTADPASLVGSLDDQAALPAIQRLRAAAIELLDPRPGLGSSTSGAAPER